MRMLLRLACLLVLGPLGGCLQGGGTDIGNALVRGKVTDEGMPVADAEVILMPAAYNPLMGDPTGLTRSIRTDADGNFRFPEVPPGAIALEILHPVRSRMDWIRPAPLGAGDSLVVASELAPARTLVVRLPAGAPEDAYAFLPGSDVHGAREPGAEMLSLPHAPAEHLGVIGIGSLAAPEAVGYYAIDVGAADTTLDLRDAEPLPR